MAPKVGKKYKTKANRNTASSSSSGRGGGGRQLVLDELDHSIYRNLMSRNWGSLCDVSHPPPTALIREFYANLSVYSEDTSGHYLTSWIRGNEYKITKHVVFEALGVPLVRRPTFPYTESPPLDDVMSLF